MSSHQWQERYRNEGDNAIVMTARTPAHQWWQRHHCNKGKMPARGRQQCHCNKGNNAIPDQGQWRNCYESNNASLTTARMPAHQQWGCCHCHDANNRNSNDGKDACTSTAMAPLQQGQQQATRATTLAWQWWRCLRINNSDDAIVTRVTIAIATLAKMTAHWRQQRHHNEGNNASLMTSNKGDDASLKAAENPLHQQQKWLHHNNGKDTCNNKHAHHGANSAA